MGRICCGWTASTRACSALWTVRISVRASSACRGARASVGRARSMGDVVIHSTVVQVAFVAPVDRHPLFYVLYDEAAVFFMLPFRSVFLEDLLFCLISEAFWRCTSTRYIPSRCRTTRRAPLLACYTRSDRLGRDDRRRTGRELLIHRSYIYEQVKCS